MVNLRYLDEAVVYAAFCLAFAGFLGLSHGDYLRDKSVTLNTSDSTTITHCFGN